MTTSKLKVLCVDSCGIYSEVAVRFVRDCASVKYFTFADEELSSKIGRGLDGVERVDSPWEHLDGVDFIFCPDVNTGSLVEYLKKKGYPVAGGGAAERLEVDRWWTRNLQTKNGMNRQETIPITGVTALKKFCKENKNYFIKVDNGMRGISESFKHVDFKASEPRIDWIAYKTGPFKEEVFFIAEEVLEGVEPGLDFVTFDGEILYPATGGYEIGKKSQINRVYRTEADLPPVYKHIHEGLAGELKKNETRFFYSAEMIVDKQGEPFLIDPTIRMASPGFSIQCELFENFTEVCHGLAVGQPVAPEIKYKYGMTSILFTTEAEKSYVAINFPDSLRRWVKLIQGCKQGKDYYSVPPEKYVATVVALGDTVKETIDLCKSRIEEVHGEGLTTDSEGLGQFEEVIAKGRKAGIEF